MDHPLPKKQTFIIKPLFDCFGRKGKQTFRYELQERPYGSFLRHYFWVDEENYSEFQAVFDKSISNDLQADLSCFDQIFHLSSTFPRQHLMFMHSKVINNLGEKCRSLTELSLQSCYLTDSAAELLPKADLKNLKHLQFRDNLITKEGVKAVTAYEYENLKKFDISHNPIENRGIKHICRAKWPMLRQLILSASIKEKDGLKYLTRCKGLERIELCSYEGTYQSYVGLLKIPVGRGLRIGQWEMKKRKLFFKNSEAKLREGECFLASKETQDWNRIGKVMISFY